MKNHLALTQNKFICTIYNSNLSCFTYTIRQQLYQFLDLILSTWHHCNFNGRATLQGRSVIIQQAAGA